MKRAPLFIVLFGFLILFAGCKKQVERRGRLLIERRSAAEDFEGQGAGNVADPEQLLRSEQGEGRDGCHGARPVHEGDPLLETQAHGGDTQEGEEFGGVAQLAPVPGLPFPDDRKREVRQVDEIARGADGTALRDAGRDSPVDEVFHEIEEFDPDAVVPLDERVQPDGHDRQ